MTSVQSAKPPVVVIDPGCRWTTGHHSTLNRFIRDHIRATGSSVRILVNRECLPDAVRGFDGEPLLSSEVYVRLDDSPKAMIGSIQHYNEAIFHDLTRHLSTLAEGTFVLVHTVNHWQLLGLNWWLKSIERTRPRVRIVLRYDPFFQVGPRSRTVVRDFYRNVLSMWRDLDGDVRFFADSRPLAAEFEALGAIRVGLIPTPVDFGHAPIPSARFNHEPSVFLFAGDARGEKGIGHLPTAVETYKAKGGKGRFVVQSLDFSTAKIQAHLKELAPEVTIVGKTLQRRDFFDFLVSGDAVLLVYDPTIYRLRNSQLLVETLGVGRAIITTAGTLMAADLSEMPAPCGLLVNEYSSAGLATGLLEFDRRKQDLLANALACADTVRQRHNFESFLGALLA